MKPSTAITDLLRAGWTESAIAQVVGTTQPTINRIKHGSAPRYEMGAALVALAQRAAPPPVNPGQKHAA